jgi:hypothetical protein
MKLTLALIEKNIDRVIECRVGREYFKVLPEKHGITVFKKMYEKEILPFNCACHIKTKFFISATLGNELLRSIRSFVEVPYSKFKVVAIYPNYNE